MLDTPELFQIVLQRLELTLLRPRVGRLGDDLVLLADFVEFHF